MLGVQKQEGLSLKKTAQRFQVGIASLVRWNRKLEPATGRHKPAVKIDMQTLSENVRLYPDETERAQRLGVSARGIRQALKCLVLTRKKHSPIPKGRRSGPSRFPQ